MGRRIGDRRAFSVEITSSGEAKPGRYLATTPYGAARKAAAKLFKTFPEADQLKFVLREITRATPSHNTLHAYVADKVSENPPRTVTKTIKDKTTGQVLKTINYTVSVQINIKSVPAEEANALIAKVVKKHPGSRPGTPENAAGPTASEAQAQAQA